MMFSYSAATIAVALLASAASQSYYSGYQDMLQAVNKARADAGLKPFCNSAKLMASSLKHSQYQASINQMTHDDPDPLMNRFTNQGFSAVAVAENVADTGDTNVAAVMTAWMNSPGHKANILGDYTHFGSAYAMGSNNRYYWTQHFAKAGSPGSEPCMDAGSAPSSTTPGGTTPSGTTPGSPIPSSPVPGSPIPSGPTPGSPMPSSPMPSGPGQQPLPGGPGQQPPSGGLGQQPLPGQQPAPGGPGQNPNQRGPSNPFSNLAPSNSALKHICTRGLCYLIVKNDLGEGFIPDGYVPGNVDISGGPVLLP